MASQVDVIVPSVGESVSSGVLGRWLVADGAAVKKGDVLFELETDKAAAEVTAPESGVVRQKTQPGTEVKVGESVGHIEVGAVAGVPAAATPNGAPAAAKAEGDKVLATPVARKVADDLGIDLAKVQGSGPHGRITREDVEAANALVTPKPQGDGGKPVAAPAPAAATPAAAAPAKPAAAPMPLPPAAAPTGEATTRERMSTLRRRIAERLVEAQHTAAMLTTFNDVDMSAVMELRKTYKEGFEKKHGVGLGFMSFFVKASIEALKAFPRVNAMIDGGDIVFHHRYHIGVAVSSDKGLMVPVIRNADQLSFAGVEKAIVHYAQKARDGKIGVDDLQGGTFTISNGGVFGSMLSTPILNPPQSGILGMHRIEERPVARGGQVVIRPMMYLALSYDHRIIDGREAVGFLVRIKECIENPARMLLEA